VRIVVYLGAGHRFGTDRVEDSPEPETECGNSASQAAALMGPAGSGAGGSRRREADADLPDALGTVTPY